MLVFAWLKAAKLLACAADTPATAAGLSEGTSWKKTDYFISNKDFYVSVTLVHSHTV